MKHLPIIIILLIGSLLSFVQCALFLNEDGYTPLSRPTEDGLPVFYLQPAPLGEGYCPATLYYRGKEYQIETRVRGSLSRRLPMKNYAIKFPEDQLFNDPEYGFENERIITLITPFNDNSCIRSRLAPDLWKQMDENHISLKTYSAVVYLNSRYWGLYTVSEHIDELLIEEHGLNRYGDLYKGKHYIADFFKKDNLHDGFEKKEGFPEDGEEGAYRVLDNFIKFVCYSSSEDFISRLGIVCNRKEYEDWWLFAVFMLGSDSCNNNAYHYHDSRNPGWRFIPWDFNNSFGQDCQTTRTDPRSGNNLIHKNNIFTRFSEEEEIWDNLEDRFSDLLSPGNIFDTTWLLSRIDEYYSEILPAARKSEKKWGERYRKFHAWNERTDFTTFEEEIQYIKDWITRRHSYLQDTYGED